MKIRLKASPDGNFKDIYRDEPMTIEALIYSLTEEELEGLERSPYRILLAKVNGSNKRLSSTIGQLEQEEGENGEVSTVGTVDQTYTIELLDMRDHGAELAYQKSLSLLYAKAVKDVLDCDVSIENSLNKGFFTRIQMDREVTQEDLDAVEARMRKLISFNLPIIKEKYNLKEALEIMDENGWYEKRDLLIQTIEARKNKKTTLYNLEGYRNYFYGPLVPSTGYIELFELRKYGDAVLLRFPYYTNPAEIPPYRDDYKLSQAFEEESEWMEILKTEHLADLNKIILRGESRDLVLLQEALHEKKVAEIADMITEQNKRIVLIAGPSSSGKTTFARRLCTQLRVNGLEPLYMGTDDYFVERSQTPLDEKGEKNYEDLEAVDIELFNSNMNDLLAGEEVDIPTFDFKKGTKIFGQRLTTIGPHQPIIIEGIHALNARLTEQIAEHEKFRIYISPLTQLNIDRHSRVPSTDARMLRRMVRDYKYRDHTAIDTLRTWPKVRAGEDKNIFPYNGQADVMFNSALIYETCLLKKYAKPLLEEIAETEPEYNEAQRLLRFMDNFVMIEEEKWVPNNSIMREFIGGSVFVE